MGDRSRGTLHKGYQDSDDEEDSDEDEDYDSDGFDEGFKAYLAQLALTDKEEALVQAAMYRIQMAQAQGRTDVSLNKHELAAMERRKKRLQEEAEKKSKDKSSRKKKKKERVAVPLTELEPVSRKKKSSSHKDSLPRLPSGSNSGDAQEHVGQPPMGYFPTAASHSRTRLGASTSQRTSSGVQDDRSASPFVYDYVQHPSRHGSDGSVRTRSSKALPAAEGWVPNVTPGSSSSGSRAQPDPFQFQTAAPHVSVSGSSSRRAAPTATRSRHVSQQDSSEESSEAESRSSDDDVETSSDSIGAEVPLRKSTRGRPMIAEPMPASEPAKSKSSKSASAKRKPVDSRRKKK